MAVKEVRSALTIRSLRLCDRRSQVGYRDCAPERVVGWCRASIVSRRGPNRHRKWASDQGSFPHGGLTINRIVRAGQATVG